VQELYFPKNCTIKQYLYVFLVTFIDIWLRNYNIVFPLDIIRTDLAKIQLILTATSTDDTDGLLYKWKYNDYFFVRLKNRPTWFTGYLHQRYTVEVEWIDQSQWNRVKWKQLYWSNPYHPTILNVAANYVILFPHVLILA